jgi:hypothetical protein
MLARLIVVPLYLISWIALAAEAPITIKVLESDTEIATDGTTVQTVHYEFRASNPVAAQGIAQQAISFSERLETLEIVEAPTLKADGRRLPVDLTKVVTQLQPGVANMPIYGDLKRMVVIYPEVGAGDGISLTWRRHVHHPLMPGAYSAISTFARTVPFDDARFSITAPVSMKLVLDAHGVQTDQETHDGKTVYRWHYRAAAVPIDPASLAPIDRVPRVFVSSIPNWDAFGHMWASLIADKAAVTPPIRTLADKLTAGITDRREQAKRLYDWVGTNIRWVAIQVGNGTIIPHTADEVLSNGYGDCKDQVMLLIALMRAKDIAAEPGLINSGNSYTLPGAAVVGAFTHCITYLPELDIYADTTVGGAPFGTLPFQDYGKPVVHAVLQGEVRHSTPVLPPGVASMSLSTKMRLDPAGEVTGDSITTAAGPYATALRGIASRAQGTGTERFAANILRNSGGTGDFTVDPLVPVAETYHLSGSFRLGPQPGWLDGDSFELPTGLGALLRPGDGLAGPMQMRDLPDTESTPCYAGQQEETLSLSLPEGRRPDRLPHDREITGEGFRYVSHYAFSDGTIVAQRRFASTFTEPLCQGAVRASVARALEPIRRDLAARFALEAAK